jgi:hypothetical protein
VNAYLLRSAKCFQKRFSRTVGKPHWRLAD